MIKFAAVLCAMSALSVVSAAQTTTRSVTNSDLEKYRQQRLSAEREYRATYAAKGLPSPDEVERRTAAKDKEMREMAARLREEALERAKLAAEIEARRASAPRNVTVVVPGATYDGTIYSAGLYGGRSFGRRFGPRIFAPRVLSGYAAGGVLWPPPVGQKPPHILNPRPFVRRPRH